MNREHRLLQGAGLLGIGALIPVFVTSPPLLDLAILTCFYLLLAGSWNMLAGFTGQFSFAHMGLAAVGAYTSPVVTDYLGLSVWASLPLAGLAAASAGVVLGAVAMRVRGVQLPLITFAFAGAFMVWLRGARSTTGGATGYMTEPLFMGIDPAPFVWLGLGLVGAFFLLQMLILDSRWGLFSTTVRDNETIAEGLGVRTFHVKLAAFSYTAFWAGVAGSFYAGYVGIIAPSLAELTQMALVVAMVVVGGMGRRMGALVGVVVLQIMGYWVRGFGQEYTLLITAAITMAVVLFARDGLIALAERAWWRLRPRRVQRWQDTAKEKAHSKRAATTR